jgi:protein TonB
MKLYSGKRIGQSSQEFAATVVFSFFLHAVFLLAALFLYTSAVPKKYIPPFYDVKLVGQSSDLLPAPSTPAAPPAAAPPPQKTTVKAKKTIPKPQAKKGDMPELVRQKQEKPVEQVQPALPAAPAQPEGRAEASPGAVKMTPEMPEFLAYSNIIRRKIADNWKHLPVPKDAKVKVVFKILRSGWVDEVRLEEASGIFQFDQAAVRAIRASSPFPPFPEDIYRPFAVFSADLTPE